MLRFVRASLTTAIVPHLTGLTLLHHWYPWSTDPYHCRCDLSHDIDLIVTQKTAQQDKKWRKRKMQEDSESNGAAKHAKCDEVVKETNGNGVSKSSANLRVKAGGHRAGYDAFMTGEL